MNNPSRLSALILGLGLVIGLSALGYLVGHAALSVKALDRTVVVKGLSEREVQADIVTWPISFQVAGNELDAVYASIESKSALVREFLAGHGITGEAVSLSPPTVEDRLAQQWGDNQDVRFRYTGTATVTVYSEDVAAVHAAMANVVTLGKRGVAVTGQVYGPHGTTQFLFSGLNDIKPSMIEEATKNAREVAQKFAKDSDSRLGKIKSASQGQFSISDRDATTAHIKKVRVVSTVEYYLAD